MMSFDFTWGLVAMSLLGNIFVNKKNILGQWIWAFANVGWIAYDISIGAYTQAFLFAMYLIICIWGIISWSREAKELAAVRVAK